MARAPSEEEFREFAHASWGSLYRTAYLLIGDAGLAEDLVQTALAKTYASWHRVRDVNAAIGYARTTLTREASGWFRRRGWRRERQVAEPPETSYDADPAERATLMAALATLPPRQRAVVVLRYYEDLSVAACAEALGCSEGTVKSQTFDALAALRERLGGDIVSTGDHHG